MSNQLNQIFLFKVFLIWSCLATLTATNTCEDYQSFLTDYKCVSESTDQLKGLNKELYIVKDSSDTEYILVVLPNNNLSKTRLQNLENQKGGVRDFDFKALYSTGSSNLIVFSTDKFNSIEHILETTNDQFIYDSHILDFGSEVLNILVKKNKFITMSDVSIDNILFKVKIYFNFIYMSNFPESNKTFTFQEHMYALGLMLYHLRFRKPVFEEPVTHLNNQILEKPIIFPKETSVDVFKMITQCFKPGPDNNTYEDMYKFFEDLRFNQSIGFYDKQMAFIPKTGEVIELADPMSLSTILLLVFVALLLIAGPIGFYIIKKAKNDKPHELTPNENLIETQPHKEKGNEEDVNK